MRLIMLVDRFCFFEIGIFSGCVIVVHVKKRKQQKIQCKFKLPRNRLLMTTFVT